eukprot:TRINITY_DN6329_c0_g1_i2.p1 TRINITY_DN6329_c0_g1~~TRINITY_DN6329_c0_g1_i2.p1  ORF type:complete len:250 (+),score=61.25 TRINITY_DN6329_c0_g1_i2:50-799(+)
MRISQALIVLLGLATLYTANAVEALVEESSGSGSGDADFCSDGCLSCTDGLCQHCVSGLALHQGQCLLACPETMIPHWLEETSALICIPKPASTTASPEESGSGSGGDDFNPNPNLCNCPSDAGAPVCWVEQLVTLPSMCIARCLNIQHVLVGACPDDGSEGGSVAINERELAASNDSNDNNDNGQRDAILIALTAGLSMSIFVIIVILVARRPKHQEQTITASTMVPSAGTQPYTTLFEANELRSSQV